MFPGARSGQRQTAAQCAGQRTKSVAVDLLRMICVGPIGRSSEYIRPHITSVSRLIRHWVTEDGKDEKERGETKKYFTTILTKLNQKQFFLRYYRFLYS